MHFQSTVKQHDSLSLQIWYCGGSRLWTRLRYSNCKSHRPRNDPKFPRNSCDSLQVVVVSQTSFLNKQLARVPIIPNQQWSMEKRIEVLSSLGAQDMDTSGYQVADHGNTELYWENDQVDADAVSRTRFHTPFSPIGD